MVQSAQRIRRLKFSLLSSGVEVSEAAREALTDGDTMVIHDYATTGGLTMVLPGGVYVNAPVDEWYTDSPAALLCVDPVGAFQLEDSMGTVPVEMVPLPYYSRHGGLDGVMTHADRVRLSPVDGCSFDCAFCDSPNSAYRLRSEESLLDGMRRALSDPLLPARHALISGGTPRVSDRAWLDRLYETIISSSDVPVDVMLAPREDNSIIDRLAEAGAAGLAINVELFGDTAARMCPHKDGLGRESYRDALSRAVAALGSGGRVRSLLLVGLEPLRDTLAGVEFIAGLGADPVLSPFRPAQSTALAGVRPPSPEFFEEAWSEASRIADEHGVQLGPRCVPCQHNTLAFPSDLL